MGSLTSPDGGPRDSQKAAVGLLAWLAAGADTGKAVVSAGGCGAGVVSAGGFTGPAPSCAAASAPSGYTVVLPASDGAATVTRPAHASRDLECVKSDFLGATGAEPCRAPRSDAGPMPNRDGCPLHFPVRQRHEIHPTSVPHGRESLAAQHSDSRWRRGFGRVTGSERAEGVIADGFPHCGFAGEPLRDG